MDSPAAQLTKLLRRPGLLLMPCCFDALSAKLIQQAGFALTFMSGFTVSATHLALPDTGLVSYGELVSLGRNICESVAIPVIGDGDTGYGNAMNVKRTVRGYARAGFAGIMIEDQVFPKRCGHIRGKQVLAREEAVQRIRAAVDARDEGADILIMARTDARGPHGFTEALERTLAFHDCGADITFLEAPLSEEEMREYCRKVPGPKMANMLEQGQTPFLSPPRLEEMGFKIAAYPLTLLNSAIVAMRNALLDLKQGRPPQGLMEFEELKELLGFPGYFEEEKKYAGRPGA
jgi:2-methylisocitrate lyase-like PEP mutase family enzyme